MNETDTISIINIDNKYCNKKTPATEVKENNEFSSKYSTIMPGLHAIVVIAICLLFAVPWTTIPRTNSIFYQTSWMEINLPVATGWVIVAATDQLNLIVWTKEKSLKSFGVFFRIYFTYLMLWTLQYILSYSVWSVYLGFNHPLPYLGMMIFLTYIIFTFFLYFILPNDLLANEDFLRKLRTYTCYVYWTILMAFQKEFISYSFIIFPTHFQFIVAIMIAAGRELDLRIRSKILSKMVGYLDEPSTVLLAVTNNSVYASFIAIRLVSMELTTAFCIMTIDFVLHAKVTYQIIRDLSKVGAAKLKNGCKETRNLITKLAVAETIEGLIPITYGCCIAMAYFGPNGHLLGNIRNSYWGYQEIEDVTSVAKMMLILFAVDTLSVLANSLCLWKIAHFRMLDEFLRIFAKYWVFMAIKIGYIMMTYFSGNDINFGQDSTNQFDWITHDGRIRLIYNSTDITAEEKSKLLANITLT